MNRAQKIILMIGIGLLTASLLFPPWLIHWRYPDSTRVEPFGYHSFMGASISTVDAFYLTIDYRFLGIQLMTISLCVIAGSLIFKKKHEH